MLSKGTWLTITGLMLAAAITGWVAFKTNQSLNQNNLPPQTPIAYGTDATVTQMDESGHIHYRAYAKKGTRYANKTSTLYNVTVELYDNPNMPPWVLVADKANITQNNQKIILTKIDRPVTVDRVATPDNPKIHIETDLANVFPKNNLITSDKLVTLTQPGTRNKLTGIGMKVELKPTHVYLLSEVKANYEPETAQ